MTTALRRGNRASARDGRFRRPAGAEARRPGMRPDVSLEDKYLLEDGRILLTGVQGLVRLPLDQHRADELAAEMAEMTLQPIAARAVHRLGQGLGQPRAVAADGGKDHPRLHVRSRSRSVIPMPQVATMSVPNRHDPKRLSNFPGRPAFVLIGRPTQTGDVIWPVP